MKKLSKSLTLKCKKIKLILTDVDGVLTDGSRYYSSTGENVKKFHVRDGMGINLLLRNKILTVIITKEKSDIVKKWACDMHASELLMGVKRKDGKLSIICKKFGITKNEIAFIGDDVNDIPLMKLVGLSATPNDANENAKHSADYVCKTDGGKGAFREIADIILATKFPQKTNWY